MVAIWGHTQEAPLDQSRGARNRLRLLVFIGVFLLVAGGGLIYDYSRPAVYLATSRVLVDPPGFGDDTAAKAQFAVSEAQSMRRSDLMNEVANRLKSSFGGAAPEIADLERWLSAQPVAQTTVIELRAEGPDRGSLAAALGSWVEVYTQSRKETDHSEGTEATAEAKHAVQTAQKAVEDKRREMEAFRRQHGIISIERDENPSAARLKGLHAALNDVSTREVNAEARLKAVQDSTADGKGVVRTADRAAIANLEMRAVDLREKMKDLEHDFTSQYLALDPKFKALKANLSRIEQQIEREKDRSYKAALIEAQEELAGAQRAAQKTREQAEALRKESQVFSTRFVELKRMAADLDQLQESRRLATDKLRKLESVRQPATVRVRVLSAPSLDENPIAPNYSRDAGIALGAGLLLAVAAVWIIDYLRRDPNREAQPTPQPIIQIAYPMLQQGQNGASVQTAAQLTASPVGLLGPSAPSSGWHELTAAEIGALWKSAPDQTRLIIAAIFAGVAPPELKHLQWQSIDLQRGVLDISGPSARTVPLIEPLLREIQSSIAQRSEPSQESPLLVTGSDGPPLDEAAVDQQLMLAAHDAGLRHSEEITGGALYYTYAAFLVRQGMRMSDLAATIGRMGAVVSSELMRLSPPGLVLPLERIERVFPTFRVG